MNHWTVKESFRALFPSLESVRSVQGTVINSNWMSTLVHFQSEDDGYYIKLYRSRGRGLRKFLGRSRVRAEWENLLLFESLKLPTAEVVAYGERSDPDYSGALVTREVRGTRDLAALVEERSVLLQDPQWRINVIRRLAGVVQTMHLHGFVHTDLKWRNILVSTGGEPQVYLIDCPLGRKMFGPFLARGRIKDLACLDKVGRLALSRTDRLRFYLMYSGRRRTVAGDRKTIHRVLSFFKGRD